MSLILATKIEKLLLHLTHTHKKNGRPLLSTAVFGFRVIVDYFALTGKVSTPLAVAL